MIFVISPAKKLDYESPLPPGLAHTTPDFVPQASKLIAQLKKKSVPQIADLMSLSPALSELNAARYKAWSPTFTEQNSRQAFWAFNGDVYAGLDAKSMKSKDIEWAQERVRILSGLYGVLKPLDWMQPYRLEMGTSLSLGKSNNLYQYWAKTITPHLNEQLKAGGHQLLVNLASQEYFKAVNTKQLAAPVLECVFEEPRDTGYKIISFMAKRARGLMVRYAIDHRVKSPEQLKEFNTDGYLFAAEASDAGRWVFRRSTP
jgi:uncharacterized protein